MKKIRVFLINEEGAREIEIDNDFRSFNKVLGWDDAWNTPTIKINGISFICVCSDTGKLRHEKVACIGINNLMHPQDYLQEPFIVGACIITKYDGVDDFESLSKEEIMLLSSSILKRTTEDSNFCFPDMLIIH